MSSIVRHPLTYIFLFALFLRLILLGAVPQGFTPDEASQAYTAYSILKTGHDEWGNLPSLTSFKSLLDYKAPLQTYLMIPSIAFFGLTQFATRLPSAIIGSLAIIAIYFLFNQLFPGKNIKLFHKKFSPGLLAAAVLAITPWQFQFSRTALEANFISLFFPLGLFFFLKALKQNNYFYLSAISFALLPYSYHSAKLFLPLILLALLFIYLPEIKPNFKKILPPLIFFILLITPSYLDFFLGSGSKRGSDVLVTDLNYLQRQQISLVQANSPLNRLSPVFSRVFDNKYTFSLDKFTENYFSYLSIPYWFTEGGREITYSIIPGTGLLFLWQMPFVALALFMLLKDLRSQTSQTLLAWLFLAPLPAALTKEGYRPNRSSAFLGLFALLTALGLYYAYKFFSQKYKNLFTLILLSLISISLVFYFNLYFFNHQIDQPQAMSYGWGQALAYISQHQSDYDHIIIQAGNQSQALAAFYLRIPPQEFQLAAKNWQTAIDANPDITYLDQIDQYQLGNITFKHFDAVSDPQPNTLYLSAKNLGLLPPTRRTLDKIIVPPDETLIEIFDLPNLNE